MESTPAILTQDLVKSYGSVRALRGVDLEVEPQEIFGFLGPNGAGKTTTIRCLLDMIRPDSGRLRVLGIDPQADPVEVRARVGYLPGELHFDENMSVEAVLRFFNRLRGSSTDWEFVRELARRLDLDLKPAVRNLSKGNKQKVGVLQALMHRPELIILDEATFGLDPLIQQEVLHLILEARQAGATVFFSSHILSEVQEIADRVAIIRKGSVVEVADPGALVERAMRRVRVRFKEEVNLSPIENLSGIQILGRDDNAAIYLQVSGEMDGLIKTLSAYPVIDLETERPSLEEIFLTYYHEDS
jgi:ABC-2 type transport system ATP-binding protein